MDIQFNAVTVLFFMAVFLFIANLVLIVGVIFAKQLKKRNLIKLLAVTSFAYVVVTFFYLSVSPEQTTVILTNNSFVMSKIIFSITGIISSLLSSLGTYLLGRSKINEE